MNLEVISKLMSEPRCYICGRTAKEAEEILKEMVTFEENWRPMKDTSRCSDMVKVSIEYMDFRRKEVVDRTSRGPPYDRKKISAKVPICSVCGGVMACKTAGLKEYVDLMM